MKVLTQTKKVLMTAIYYDDSSLSLEHNERASFYEFATTGAITLNRCVQSDMLKHSQRVRASAPSH